MEQTKGSIIALTRLGPKGQLTIPAEYRRALSLSGDTAVALVPVGDVLVVAPQDQALAAVTGRLEAQMHGAGSDVDDLLTAAAEARAEIVPEQFGAAGEEGDAHGSNGDGAAVGSAREVPIGAHRAA